MLQLRYFLEKYQEHFKIISCKNISSAFCSSFCNKNKDKDGTPEICFFVFYLWFINHINLQSKQLYNSYTLNLKLNLNFRSFEKKCFEKQLENVHSSSHLKCTQLIAFKMKIHFNHPLPPAPNIPFKRFSLWKKFHKWT